MVNRDDSRGCQSCALGIDRLRHRTHTLHPTGRPGSPVNPTAITDAPQLGQANHALSRLMHPCPALRLRCTSTETSPWDNVTASMERQTLGGKAEDAVRREMIARRSR